jgi:hypothetical protein
MIAELTIFEALAVYSAHMRHAEQFDARATEMRQRAGKRDILWQRYLRLAIHRPASRALEETGSR